MTDSLTILQWAVLSLSALCIGMSKTGVQGMMLLPTAVVRFFVAIIADRLISGKAQTPVFNSAHIIILSSNSVIFA